MATLIERVRNVISSEIDDYFENTTFLYYINQAKKEIVSTLQRREYTDRITLRALDSLRKRDEIDITGVSFSELDTYFIFKISVPNDMERDLFLRYGNNTPLRSIHASNLFQLHLGNIKPSKDEGYYIVLDGEFEVYVKTNTESKVDIFYVKELTELGLASENLIDIPDRLINAVVYRAAHMAVLQEGVEVEGDAIYQQNLKSLADESLEINIF